jgi:hypothetical protein
VAVSSQVKNFLAAVVRFSDGTGTPVTLVLDLDQGNYALSGLMAKLNELVKFESRGKFKGLGRGNRAYPQFSLGAWVANLIGSATSGTGTPLEFVFGKGAYSANLSTLGASREITIDIRLTIEGTAHGDAAAETIDLEDVVITLDFQEGPEGNVINMQGEVCGAVVITNSVNTVTLAQAA